MIFKAVPYPLSLKISRVTQAYLLPSLLNVVKLRLRKSMHKVLWPKKNCLETIICLQLFPLYHFDFYHYYVPSKTHFYFINVNVF